MQRHELEAWLGPAADDLTDDQIDRLAREADRIGERYPDPDEAPERDAALSAAVQIMLGDTDPDQTGRALTAARLAEAAAYAAAVQVAVMLVDDGVSEVEAARRVQIDRMSVRKALGKR